MRPATELTAVAALVTADLWLVWDRPWLLAVVRALAAAVVIASLLRRRTERATAVPGMRAGEAWLEALAATMMLGIGVIVWAGVVAGPLEEPDFSLLVAPAPALGRWLMRHLGLAAVQQLVLQRFLWPVTLQALGEAPRAIVVVVALFGLFHLPSVALGVATAVAAAVWLHLYRRSGRLAPLIASHVLLAAIASTLPERMFYRMQVGAPALDVAAAQRALAGEERQALLRTVGSPRYAAYRGGTDRGYVEGLYRDLLGRIATEEEVRDSLARLVTSSRQALAERMLLAPELDDASLWRRVIDDQPLAPGVEIAPGSDAPDSTDFTGWYPAEAEWRWARDPAPEIRFRADRQPGRDYVLAVSGGVAAPETHPRPLTVELELNGDIVGTGRFTDFTALDYRFLLDPEQLAGGDNVLRFLVSGAPVVLEGDSRALGFGLRRLRIAPLRLPAAAVLFDQDDYFLEGFSVAEERLRWTREPVARLAYPLREIVAGGCYALQLRAGAFERQQVGLSVNGQGVAEWTLDGLEPQTRSIRLDAEDLRPGPNMVDFHLPGARSPEGDPRRLGLALISLRLYPLRDCR